MTNRTRGLFDIKVDDTTYKLQFTTNAMAELEDAANKGFPEFLGHLEKSTENGTLRVGDVRLLFWAGLKEHQPDITVVKAGQIVQDIGGVEAAMEKLGEAITAAMPEAKAGDADSEGKPEAAA
ncbi:GTA-gp10 family protein [Tateyamaria sp. syn59]|uniref:GTA-gp10 family protein n=1 Tax=Tateyamaria sp. syn59 TaxID=2576942 RepID=UPI0011BF45DA|nr:GTA-gp10 family protein [Tateyamaria sp. syn59]